jgi:hypothetical protein
MAGLSPNLLDGIDPKLFPFDPDQQIASLTQSNSSLAIMNPDVADSSAASHRDLTIAEHHPASSSMGTEEYEALGKLTYSLHEILMHVLTFCKLMMMTYFRQLFETLPPTEKTQSGSSS